MDFSMKPSSFTVLLIVVDASSTQERIDRWEEECAEAGVRCHRVDRDGAFVLGSK